MLSRDLWPLTLNVSIQEGFVAFKEGRDMFNSEKISVNDEDVRLLSSGVYSLHYYLWGHWFYFLFLFLFSSSIESGGVEETSIWISFTKLIYSGF